MAQLPDAFIRRTADLLGQDRGKALCEALNGETPVSVRLNPTKSHVGLFANAEQVPWCTRGRYLESRPAFTADPLLHAGCYYVQEAASMFVEQAFKTIDETPTRVLDLCAAPGGKSTLWRSLLPDGCLLVANEPVRQRAMVLAENLTKWGHPDVVVTQSYPADFAPLGSIFDIVAADVPCSGEGMFRKDEGARDEWSVEAVAQCAARQRQIVRDVWPALRQGGWLVYSTCTFNREENEDNIDYICRELGAECVPVAFDATWAIDGDQTGRGLPVCHFFPDRARGEGFFLALLRKTAETDLPRRVKDRRRSGKDTPPAGVRQVTPWLKDTRQYKILQRPDGGLYAVREALAEVIGRIQACANVIQAGVDLAEPKGNKLVPAHAIALSTALSDEAFPRTNLDRTQALAYLRREALVLPADTPRGYVVACHEGHPLGFVNNLGARANNAYPAEWRIRSRHLS